MKIYLKTKKKFETIQELLQLLFSCEKSGYISNVATYANEECTTIQCSAGRNRSFKEVYYIVNTYFPKTTQKKCCIIY